MSIHEKIQTVRRYKVLADVNHNFDEGERSGEVIKRLIQIQDELAALESRKWTAIGAGNSAEARKLDGEMKELNREVAKISAPFVEKLHREIVDLSTPDDPPAQDLNRTSDAGKEPSALPCDGPSGAQQVAPTLQKPAPPSVPNQVDVHQGVNERNVETAATHVTVPTKNRKASGKPDEVSKPPTKRKATSGTDPGSARKVARGSEAEKEAERVCRNKTGYWGVYANGRGRYIALISNKGRGVHLGTFDTPESAALAFNKASKERSGDKATLNRVPGYSPGPTSKEGQAPVTPAGGGRGNAPATKPSVPAGGGRGKAPATKSSVPAGGGRGKAPATKSSVPAGGGREKAPATKPSVPAGGGRGKAPATKPSVPAGRARRNAAARGKPAKGGGRGPRGRGQGKSLELGTFEDPIEAARTYNKEGLARLGAAAKLSDIPERNQDITSAGNSHAVPGILNTSHEHNLGDPMDAARQTNEEAIPQGGAAGPIRLPTPPNRDPRLRVRADASSQAFGDGVQSQGNAQ